MNFKIFSLYCLAILLFLSCQKVPVYQYYMIHYTPLAETRQEAYPFVVRIRDFIISEVYRRPQIAFRFSPYEIQYYNFRMWGVKPQSAMADLLTRHLNKANLFQEVIQQYHEKKPDFEISGEISAIEEFDNDIEKFAHLAMKLRLTSYIDRKLLIEHSFDVRKKVFQTEMIYIIRTLSQILEEETAVFLRKTNEFLKSYNEKQK